jgi:hypothetical protein
MSSEGKAFSRKVLVDNQKTLKLHKLEKNLYLSRKCHKANIGRMGRGGHRKFLRWGKNRCEILAKHKNFGMFVESLGMFVEKYLVCPEIFFRMSGKLC